MENKFESNKFNFRELFNNSQGQTAIALLSAFLIIFTGCLAFAYCVFSEKAELLTQCTSLVGIGVSVYLGRNVKDALKK